MTTRLIIINNLISDLRTTLVTGAPHTGYSIKVHEARVGVFDPEKFSSLPSIGIWTVDDDPEDDMMDDSIFRTLNFVVYGYVDANDMNDYTIFYQLIEDIETFLYSSDNRMYQNTILGKLLTDYGGVQEQAATFVYNFLIKYSQTGLES